MQVAKRRGMERENLLDENGGQQQQQQEGGGLWNKVSSMFSDKKQQQNKTINVFSLASGHMYERLMKIMMLSVMNHTSPATPVRFYLIRQFFSPRYALLRFGIIRQAMHNISCPFGLN